MKKIVTLTINPTIDKSTAVTSVASEIKLRCDAPRFDPGGGGINVSRAIRKLGGESVAVYTAGDSPGRLLSELLHNEDITCHPIEVAGYTRESWTVFEKSTTLQYRFGMPGPHLSESEWSACLDAVFALEADYIVASGSLPPGVPPDFYAVLARRARAAGIRAIVDTSGPALEQAADAGIFLLKPNLRELEILSGHAFEGETQLRDTARELIARGTAEVIIISMGAQGALFVSADDAAQLRTPAVPISSKVGAGDSMVGGVVLALARGEGLLDAARWGVAAGTATVMTDGTQLCNRADTERIYSQIDVLRHPG